MPGDEADSPRQGSKLTVDQGKAIKGESSFGPAGAVSPRKATPPQTTPREGGGPEGGDDLYKRIDLRITGITDQLWDAVNMLRDNVGRLDKETTRIGSKSSLEAAHNKNSIDSMALDGAAVKEQLGDFSEWMERMAVRQADSERRLQDELVSLSESMNAETAGAKNTLGRSIAILEERLNVEVQARPTIEAKMKEMDERLPSRARAEVAQDLEALKDDLLTSLKVQNQMAQTTFLKVEEYRPEMEAVRREIAEREQAQAKKNTELDAKLTDLRESENFAKDKLKADYESKIREVDQRLSLALDGLTQRSTDLLTQLRRDLDDNVTKLRGESSIISNKIEAADARQRQLQDQFTQLQSTNNNFQQQMKELATNTTLIKTDVDDCRSRVAKDIKDLRRDLDETEKALQQSVSQVRKSLERTGEQIDGLRDVTIAGLNDHLGQAFSQINDTKRRCTDLEVASSRHDEQLVNWGNEFASRLDGAKEMIKTLDEREVKLHAGHDKMHQLNQSGVTELRQYIEKVETKTVNWGKAFDEKLNEVRTGAKADLEANALSAFQHELKLWTKVIQMGQAPLGALPPGSPASQPVWDVASQAYRVWDPHSGTWKFVSIPGSSQ